ncbi:YybH family protein [Salinactinospora qingdaonensis]|uniref:SnoaL-like domain-containing protein n=1 Tax=Salinactinospora qingdaonensis TaxID=702744 RepID=A0ABP7G0J7_9ACTN
MTMTEASLDEQSVRLLVKEWYEALDRHDPEEKLISFLASDGLVMNFPEGTLRGIDGFRSWYQAVTNKFFDEIHEITSVDVRMLSPVHAEVRVVVNWQTKVWNAPAPNSEWLGFDATQTWSVVLQDGTPRIRTYTVDDLTPMPGSAELDA